MQISYFPKSCALNSGPVVEAFLHSCRSAGIDVTANSMDADAAVIWSQLWAGRMRPNQQVWQHYRQTNRPVIVLEVGTLKRNHTWRVMLNGLHQPLKYHNNSDRASQFNISVKPWQHHDGSILVVLQRSDSNLWHNMPDVQQWVSQTVSTIRQYTDRPIVVRPHPRQTVNLAGVEIQTPKMIVDTYDDFDLNDGLTNAYAVINHNSTGAVQSVLHGTPTIVSSSSIAAPMAVTDLSQINQLVRPDRTQWINDLAWSEWTVEEIAQGIPLQLLNISKTSI